MSLKNKLNDISIRTMIGLLPRIINENNQSISDYIDNIYDDNNLYIKVNIDNIDDLKSYVKSYSGIFKTITVDNFNIKDTKSLEKIIRGGESDNDGINHDALNGRYLYNDGGLLETVPYDEINSEMKKYAHNSGAIGVELGNGTVLSLADTLELIINSVDSLKKLFSNSYSDERGYIGLYGASKSYELSLNEPLSFTFDLSMLFATAIQLKRMNLPKYQYNDIKSGFIYTYYDYNHTVTINDEHTASINGIPGSIVKLRFNDTKSKAFYRVILSREENKFLRISKDELNRITLKCIVNDDEFGSTWDVLDYSVRSADDIMIERK